MSYEIPKKYLGGKGKEIINEDIRNMNYALNASTASLDPSTKVGACYVSKEGKILTLGCNKPSWDPDKFPWGNREDEIGRENTKYPYVDHAEIVSALSYGGLLFDFIGSTLYVTLYPCPECTKFLALLGVKKVVYLNKRLYGDVDESEVTMDKNNIEHINLKERLGIEKLEFDYMENEKNNIKVSMVNNKKMALKRYNIKDNSKE